MMIGHSPSNSEHKKINLFMETDFDACDEAKGDSQNSPVYSTKNKSNKKTKKVSFHHTAFVVLIPTVDEYHRAGLAEQLWWNDLDFHSFKTSTAEEVKEHMRSLNIPTFDAKSGLKLYFRQFLNSEDLANTQNNLTLTLEPSTTHKQKLLRELKENNKQFKQDQQFTMVVAQRSDSITSNKFKNEQSPQRKSLTSRDYPQTLPFPPLPPPATSSTSSNLSSDNPEGASSVDLTILAKMVAAGLFVFVNRS